ncbi:MAG: methyltransferase domain-containing protein [Candidatus Paceibacterota bacterium]
MKKRFKSIIYYLYFYLFPQKNASYRYKSKRLLTNLKYFFNKKLKRGYFLSSEEISLRNRGDDNVSLSDEIVKDQFKILDAYYDFITKYLLIPGESLLDVGSREGYLLNRMTNAGYEVEGFEVVPEWVTYCHSKQMDYIKNIDLLELDTRDYKKFDVVFSRHTLEHVDRTKLFFDQLVALTKPGKKLFVVFPLNLKPNFKHPSYLPSLKYIKEKFDYTQLNSVTISRLDELKYNDVKTNLTDKRESDEIVIIATKNEG